jgi:hypothetical protein
MRKNSQPVFGLFLFLGVLFLPFGAFSEYEILLKSGSTIKTDSYYEEGNKIKYLRYGNYIGIGKDNVDKIREVEPELHYEQVIPDPNLFNRPSSDGATEVFMENNTSNDKKDASAIKASNGLTRSVEGSQAFGTGKNDEDQAVRHELYYRLQKYEGMKKINCGQNDYESQSRCREAEAGLQAVKEQLKKMGLPAEKP